MNYKLSLPAAIALGLAAAAPAHAEIRLSGFGQVVGGMLTDEDDAFPTLRYDDRADFREESLFALQASANLNETMSATAQVIARGVQDFDAEFAWAYATWQPNDAVSLRVGRQRTPFYKYSDYLEVGYAYPWVRPPGAVYNLGFNNYDGLNLGYSKNLGRWYSQIQLIAGGFEGDSSLRSETPIELDNLVGIAWDATYDDWLSLRAAYFRSKVTTEDPALAPLLGGLRQTGFGDVADAIAFDDDTGTFAEVGFEVNRAAWQVIGEYVKVKVEDSLYAEGDEWYVSAGYRIGAWTPNLTYGARDKDAKLDVAAALPNGFPLAAPTRAVLASQAVQADYVGFGVRWDVAKNMALKADYTRYSADPDADAGLASAAFVFTF